MHNTSENMYKKIQIESRMSVWILITCIDLGVKIYLLIVRANTDWYDCSFNQFQLVQKTTCLRAHDKKNYNKVGHKIYCIYFQEKLDKALWNRHDLVELTFHIPTNCDLCVKPLSGFIRPPPAYECKSTIFFIFQKYLRRLLILLCVL